MKPIVVTTKQGESYRGVRRFAWLRPVVVLEHVEALGRGPTGAHTAQPLLGRVEIPAANVALIQRLPEPRPQLAAEPAEQPA